MKRYINTLAIAGLALTMVVSGQVSDCQKCIDNPCGCELFKCSKPIMFPSEKIDYSKGFQGCQNTASPYVAGEVLRTLHGTCKCPYVKLTKDCKPVKNTGIIVGSGFDLAFMSETSLKNLGEPLLTKLKPYFGLKSDPISFIKEHPLELTDAELLMIDETFMVNDLSDIRMSY